jgi:hypothetical protein
MDNLKNELGIDEEKPIPSDYSIPYFVHQDDMNKMDMSHKRIETWHLGIIILLIILLVGSNLWWIYYENQFEDTVTVTQDTPNGNNNFIGRDGDITNGSTNDN